MTSDSFAVQTYKTKVSTRFKPLVIKCWCKSKNGWFVKNFDRMWGDGEVHCISCQGYIRDYDTG